MRILVVNLYLDRERHGSSFSRLLSELEKTSGAMLEPIYYTEVGDIGSYDCVVLSGTEGYLSEEETTRRFSKLASAIRESETPVLGVCGGHQLIGVAYSSRVVSLGKLVKGYREVRVLVDDEVFDGLPETIVVCESHRECVEKLPEGFSKLASSADTEIEAMKLKHPLRYGFQFHPERSDEKHPHGRVILENFFRILRR